jgi:hypothetical protein
VTVKRPYLSPVPPTLAACPWLGWVRVQGQPWKPLLGAETYDECQTRLVNLVVGVSCDKVCLEQGRRP